MFWIGVAFLQAGDATNDDGLAGYKYIGNGVCVNIDGDRVPYCQKIGVPQRECVSTCSAHPGCMGFQTFEEYCFLNLAFGQAPGGYGNCYGQSSALHIQDVDDETRAHCYRNDVRLAKAKATTLTKLAIEQNMTEHDRHEKIIKSQGYYCDCPDIDMKTWLPVLHQLTRAGKLQEPDIYLHEACDSARSDIAEFINWDTWGRTDRTDCEPKMVALCVVCGVSLTARGEVSIGTKYFAAAVVTLGSTLLSCYDKSKWPFMTEEILENFVRLLEEGQDFQWEAMHRPFRIGDVYSGTMEPRHSADKVGVVSLWELTFRVRSVLGLVEGLSRLPSVLQSYEKYAEELTKKGLPSADWWTYADICAHAWAAYNDTRLTTLQQQASLRHVGNQDSNLTLVGPFDVIRVLNAFAGLFPPAQDMRCDHAEHPLGLQITSIDKHARAYLAAFAKHGWVPRNGAAQYCDVDELWRCFPKGLFEVVHVRNGLDHTVQPLQAVRQLVRATRPGGRLILWHWQNEHPEPWKGITSGPHQWGFDLCPSSEAYAGLQPPGCNLNRDTTGWNQHPFLWNYAHTYNLTHELLREAELISARYETDLGVLSDPETFVSTNRWVVVEFRRRKQV